MSDQNKRTADEYQYPGEEYVVEPTETTPDKETVTKKTVSQAGEPAAWKQFVMNNRRKLLVVLIVLVLLVAFQIMKHKENNKVIMQAPEQPKVTQTQPSQFQPSNEDRSMLQQSLALIQQSGTENAQEISQLKSQLDDMHSQMQEVSETNDQMKKAMVLLLQELKNINENMQVKMPKKTALPKPNLVYSIRAMVDGRAWILGSNGLAESVTVGEPIPGYGNVTGIYPARGLITTTTGKSIRLGDNDF